MAKIKDLTMLSDIFPTGYHGAVTAGVTTGSTVYVAGAGPVGLACATSGHLLGAAVVIVGDMMTDRLAQAASFGCETIDLSAHDDLRRADRADPRRAARSTPPSTASASRPAATAPRAPRARRPRPCSTR